MVTTAGEHASLAAEPTSLYATMSEDRATEATSRLAGVPIPLPARSTMHPTAALPERPTATTAHSAPAVGLAACAAPPAPRLSVAPTIRAAVLSADARGQAAYHVATPPLPPAPLRLTAPLTSLRLHRAATPHPLAAAHPVAPVRLADALWAQAVHAR